MATTREKLLSDEHSGARPLGGAAPASRPRAPRKRATAAPSPGTAAPRRTSPAAAPAAADPADDDDAKPGGRDYTTQGAGAFLALFAYPLLINLLDGGPAQMWGWVKAKWVNQPYGGGSSSGPTPQAAQSTRAPTPSGYATPNPYLTR